MKIKKLTILIVLLGIGILTPSGRADAKQRKSPFQGKLISSTWIKDFSTNKAYRIKQYPDGEWPVIGEMSPPGDLIVFDSMVRSDGGKEISVLKLIGSDGASEKVLLRSIGGFKPTWSPDGKFILVNISEYGDKIIIEKDSLSAWKLGIPNGVDVGWMNWWGKNGETILFVTQQREYPDTNEIYRMRLDGSQLEKIMDVDVPPGAGGFDLSPDEKKLVGDYGDLFLIDLEKKDARYLWRTRYVEMNPQWSPDGKWVAYLKTGETHRPSDKWYARNIETGKIKEIGDSIPYVVQWWHPPTAEPVDCEPIVRTLLKGREVDLKAIQKELDKNLPKSAAASH